MGRVRSACDKEKSEVTSANLAVLFAYLKPEGNAKGRPGVKVLTLTSSERGRSRYRRHETTSMIGAVKPEEE